MADDRLQIFSHDDELRSLPPIAGNADGATLSRHADHRPAGVTSELPVCTWLSPFQEDQSHVHPQPLPFTTPSSEPSPRRSKRKPAAWTWDGLSHDHKAILYATAARDLNFDRSITIRLFREHETLAAAEGKSLREWAVKQFQNAIKRACHLYPDAKLDYVLAIEPHETFLSEVKTEMYRWSPERSFDLHIALVSGSVPDLWPALEEQLERGFRQRRPGQRQFHSQKITEERGGPRGWVLYCLKNAHRTATDHSDIILGRPWAVSQGVTRDARARLDAMVADIGKDQALWMMTAGKQFEAELLKALRARKRDRKQLLKQQTPA